MAQVVVWQPVWYPACLLDGLTGSGWNTCVGRFRGSSQEHSRPSIPRRDIPGASVVPAPVQPHRWKLTRRTALGCLVAHYVIPRLSSSSISSARAHSVQDDAIQFPFAAPSRTVQISSPNAKNGADSVIYGSKRLSETSTTGSRIAVRISWLSLGGICARSCAICGVKVRTTRKTPGDDFPRSERVRSALCDIA